ncbi:MAG: hypothetical protein PHV97_05425 [Candidatus Omnitrophica bacterium]|nr:hypothetical protein [Candidatus Omnitrophota bacterium]
MQKTALRVSGVIFLVVALLHAWRYLMKVPVSFGQTSIPLELSFAGAVVCFLLALWMFSAARKS